MGVDETKRLLREVARRRRRCLDAPWVTATSARLCARVLAAPAFAATRRLVAYCATEGEVDPTAVVTAARASGIPVYLPRFAGGDLTFVTADGPLRPGRHGIPEPASGAPLTDAGSETTVLVPGLAFDLTGTRLGRGGGHYDRVLAAWPAANTIGLAFECQILPRLPRDPWDVPVATVATESRLVAGTAPSDVG
jgi:5-formyltetrahydrofolate cyclo-ligase